MPSRSNSAAIDGDGAAKRSTASKTRAAAASRSSISCLVSESDARPAAFTRRLTSHGNRRDIVMAARRIRPGARVTAATAPNEICA